MVLVSTVGLFFGSVCSPLSTRESAVHGFVGEKGSSAVMPSRVYPNSREPGRDSLTLRNTQGRSPQEITLIQRAVPPTPVSSFPNDWSPHRCQRSPSRTSWSLREREMSLGSGSCRGRAAGRRGNGAAAGSSKWRRWAGPAAAARARQGRGRAGGARWNRGEVAGGARLWGTRALPQGAQPRAGGRGPARGASAPACAEMAPEVVWLLQ